MLQDACRATAFKAMLDVIEGREGNSKTRGGANKNNIG